MIEVNTDTYAYADTLVKAIAQATKGLNAALAETQADPVLGLMLACGVMMQTAAEGRKLPIGEVLSAAQTVGEGWPHRRGMH